MIIGFDKNLDKQFDEIFKKSDACKEEVKKALSEACNTGNDSYNVSDELTITRINLNKLGVGNDKSVT